MNKKSPAIIHLMAGDFYVLYKNYYFLIIFLVSPLVYFTM